MSFCLYGENECVLWEHDGTQYALRVERDDDSLNPREDWDNLTTMACWHRRYNLGDKKDFGDPEDFWRGLVRDLVPEQDVLRALADHSIDSVKVEQCEDDDELMTVYYLGYNGRYDYHDDYDVRHCLDDGVICNLDIKDCQILLEPYLEWMPLWLYDHGGITMSCGSRGSQYADRWDSGQVGWIVVKKEAVVSNWGCSDESWRRRAVETMEADVSVYDQYLTGDVYFFQLYELQDDEWVETDSCGGFFGDDLLENGICDYTPGLYAAINENRAKTGRVEKHCSYSYSFAV